MSTPNPTIKRRRPRRIDRAGLPLVACQRVSTAGQTESGLGLDDQAETSDAWSTVQRIEIADTFTDTGSRRAGPTARAPPRRMYLYRRLMAIDFVVQRLQIGDVVLADFPDQGGEVEATVVRDIGRTESTVRVTRTSPESLLGTLRMLTFQADRELAIMDASTGPVVAGAGNLPVSIMAGLAGMLGLLALVLAMAGLYGVLSHVVAHRTKEMGVRLALGASRRQIIWLVLVDGVGSVVVGLVIGFVLADVAGMALRPLFERFLPAVDPTVLVVVPVLYLIAAIAACYLPARRAAHVDPNVALRQG